jgi:hypothetical protein
VLVELVLVQAHRSGHIELVGALAADDSGSFRGSVIMPRTLTLGEYDILARTYGDARCGRGASK